MKNRVGLIAFLFFLFSACITNFVTGQSEETAAVSFQAEASFSSIHIESGFIVDFIISDDTLEKKGFDGDFTPPLFHGFRVLNGPNITSATTVTRGIVKRKKTYSYTLLANELGKQEILPGSLSFDGDTLYTETANIQVLAQTISPDSISFIQAKLSTKEAYIGQQVWLDLNYYFTKDTPRSALVLNKEEYPFFSHTLHSGFEPKFEATTINGVSYYVARLKKVALFPQVAGALVVPAQEVLIGGSSMGKLVLSSDAIILEVLDYPNPVPLSFRGAVDVIDMSMERKTAAVTDEWISVDIKLRSNGDILRTAAPKLGVQGLDDQSNIYSIKDNVSNLAGRSESSERLITYRFDDELTINELHPEVIYFDTDLRKFMRCNLDSSGLPLLVSNEGIEVDHLKEETDTLSNFHDLVLVIDVSSSMLAQDFQPNRIDFIKNHLIQQLSTMPDHTRVGVVAFSGTAVPVCPLTADIEELRSAISELKVNMLIDGTSHGHGIATALNMIKKSPSKHTSILMISDGASNINFLPPLAAAACARGMGVRVYTAVIGSGKETLVPVSKNSAGEYRYGLGTLELDTVALVEIAEMTGGNFQLISNAMNAEINFKTIIAPSSELPVLPAHPMYDVIAGQSIQNLNLWLNVFEMEKFKILAE